MKEQDLASSFYGKYFARNLNLYLLRRRPDQWRDNQSSRRHVEDKGPSAIYSETISSTNATAAIDRRKRRNRTEDEIDVLFDEKFGKMTKKAALFVGIPSANSNTSKIQHSQEQDGGLEQIFGAIRSVSEKKKKIHK